jgi:predicted nicotinamide N-methyase
MSAAQQNWRMGATEGHRRPLTDFVTGTLEVAGGWIEFMHPRDPAMLPHDEDLVAGMVYPPHWAQLWPSGVELAEAVSAHDWRGAAVLELGCGLGLPSVAAALAGARVLATDRSPDAVAVVARNAERNGTTVDAIECTWDASGPVIARAPWQLVLAADVLYGQRNIDELLALLPRLVDDDGEVWIADPQRPLTEEFLATARRAWRVVEMDETRQPEVRIHRLRGPRRARGHRS